MLLIDRRVEAGPARAALKLCVGGEERHVGDGADPRALGLGVVLRALVGRLPAEGPLGRLAQQHVLREPGQRRGQLLHLGPREGRHVVARLRRRGRARRERQSEGRQHGVSSARSGRGASPRACAHAHRRARAHAPAAARVAGPAQSPRPLRHARHTATVGAVATRAAPPQPRTAALSKGRSWGSLAARRARVRRAAARTARRAPRRAAHL